MATTSTTIAHGIMLGFTGTAVHGLPLTITSLGVVSGAGPSDAVYGPGIQAWTIGNAGTIDAMPGFVLTGGGGVDNADSRTGVDPVRRGGDQVGPSRDRLALSRRGQ